MGPVPITCTLEADDASLRSAEWRRFLADNVAEIERSATSVRLRLKEDDGGNVLVVVDLARREKACCAFFDFRLVPLPEAVWLEVDAPLEAVAILDELVNLRTD